MTGCTSLQKITREPLCGPFGQAPTPINVALLDLSAGEAATAVVGLAPRTGRAD
jgi:hypothetical protein